jgi:hypothetical protein
VLASFSIMPRESGVSSSIIIAYCLGEKLKEKNFETLMSDFGAFLKD